MKYSSMDWGTMEAVVNKLGGMEGVSRFLRNELSVSEPPRSWAEKDGVISFSVTSDGTTGKQWIARLGEKGLRVSDYAKSVLLSPDFKPTTNITTKVAVLNGELFSDGNRITKKIRAEAAKRNLETPNAELACLIREKFTDDDIEAMGLWWIIAMHEPIKDFDGDLDLLGADRRGVGLWLSAVCGRPGSGWRRGGGFAFAVPPEPSSSNTKP